MVKTYWVGGTARDMISGITPNDLDMAIDSQSKEAAELFFEENDAVFEETGKAFPVYRVQFEDFPEQVEVSLFRKEVSTGPGHSDFTIEIAANIAEDLERRDFTVNAMAIDMYGNITDPYNGQRDLGDKILRSVPKSGPRNTYQQDPLRILRAARFCENNGYSLAEGEIDKMKAAADDFLSLSSERIGAEIIKMLSRRSLKPGLFWQICDSAGVLQHFLPELVALKGLEYPSRYHYADPYTHTIDSYKSARNLALDPDPVTGLTMILHDIGKASCISKDENGVVHYYGHAEKGAEMIPGIIARLAIGSTIGDKVTKYTTAHMEMHFAKTGKAVRKLARAFDMTKEEMYDMALIVQSDSYATVLKEDVNLVIIEEAFSVPVAVRQLPINGDDLIALGMKQGRQIGIVLAKVLDEIDNGNLVSREDCLRYARKEVI